VQGFEPMIGMHCIATLLFTQMLLPQLSAAVSAASETPGSVHVVWTSAFLVDAVSPINGVEFELLEKDTADRTRNYAVSKVGTWMLRREFARRYGDEGIASVIQNLGNLKAG
jgi:NAD(P)-dependent dehydrogenase (short-subunit alcohol dehydrogenase family)